MEEVGREIVCIPLIAFLGNRTASDYQIAFDLSVTLYHVALDKMISDYMYSSLGLY